MILSIHLLHKGILYFRGESLSFDGDVSFSNLEYRKVNKGVELYSCHGGSGKEGNNVAWMFSKKTGATVRACQGSVSFSKIFGKYYARTDGTGIWANYYYNKKGVAKWSIGI